MKEVNYMTKCPNCAAELDDSIKFCVKCGTKIEQPAQEPSVPVVEEVQEKTTKKKAEVEVKPEEVKDSSKPAGVKAATPVAAAPQSAVHIPAQPVAQPVYAAPPQPAYVPAPPSETKKKNNRPAKEGVVPIRNYFWSTLLFSIPVIGWLCCIITACGGTKYDSKRNWARSLLVWVLVGIIFMIILGILALIFQNQILAFISYNVGYEITSLQELWGLILDGWYYY